MSNVQGLNQGDKAARSIKFREQMIEKWRSEIGQIETEVVTLYHSRSIYKRLFEIVDANPRIQKGNALYEWLHRSYVVYASTAIRRLLDKHKDALSLAKLVESMKANEHILTREWFVSQRQIVRTSRYPQYHRKLANKDFDKLAGVGKNAVDGGDLQRRLDAAESLSSLVKAYVDKLVAHKDEKPPAKLPTYGGLDSAIDAVGDLFEHLHALLNQSSLVRLEPVEQFRWERLLEEPWIIQPDRPSACREGEDREENSTLLSPDRPKEHR